jgi:hypothetical protein
VCIVSNVPEYDNKAGYVLRGRKVFITSGHDKSNDTLQANADGEGVAGTNPVTHEGSKGRTWNVKQVDDSSPAKAFPERGTFP